jgi:pimeloyl-ACP methyl ester carboxylesterase
MHTLSPALALASVLAVAPGAASSSAGGSALVLHPCTVGHSKTPARCGTLTVFENRAARTGRTIALHFVILNAKTPSKRAIFWNPGGPGASAVAAAPFIADGVVSKYLTTLRDRYNIVLLDNRGTGASHPLQCDLSPPAHPSYYFLQIWPDALLKSCRARHAVDTDLSAYATIAAADDLDDVRAALGYPKIVLDGGSYGTRFYLAYIRQHPAHVESALLEGVAPPHFLIIPLEDAAGFQMAMDHLSAACSRDSACNAHFPDFGRHFAALARRFADGPVRARIHNATTKRYETVLLSKEVFADRLRQTLYSVKTAAYVPFIVERAHNGDYVPLGAMIEATTQGLAGIVAVGLNLSVTCAEDIPFITEADVARTSAGSLEGDARVRAQQRACRIWNVRAVPAGFVEPVHSNAPILMVSGSDDPATPPSYATDALRYLPNAAQLLIRGASHGTTLECSDRLKVAFVLAGSAKGLDLAACSGAFRRPPFATSMAGFGN